MRKSNRGIRILITLCCVLLLIALLSSGAGWLSALFQSKHATVELNEQLWPQNATVGETLTAQLTVKCPWGVAPAQIDVTVPKEMIEYGTPEIRWDSLGWAQSEYSVFLQVRAVAPGEAEATPVAVSFDSLSSNKPDSWHGELPAIKITRSEAVDANAQLPLAGQLSPADVAGEMQWGWILAIAALAGAVAAIWWLRRSRMPKEAAMPPWVRAEREIHVLREEVKQNRNLNRCLGRLTDVVRQYLEERFYLPSTRQTTTEFLRTMNDGHSPLTEEQRENLARFMTAADLVKFAGQQADAMLLNPALDKAEELIEETTPKPEENTGEATEVDHV